jgi:hypothetical protein
MVQLHTSDGATACYAAVLGQVLKNDTDLFKAK